jgi:hypothetical protein
MLPRQQIHSRHLPPTSGHFSSKHLKVNLARSLEVTWNIVDSNVNDNGARLYPISLDMIGSPNRDD